VNIADILAQVHLNLETGEFEANAAKVGDRAGATIGQRMSDAIKVGIGGAAGAAFGAATAAAVKGGAELNAAVTQFAADTGATVDDAAEAQTTIGELFRTNLQSFGEIGGTLAVLRTDLGLTQDAADQAAQSYLDFAQVAGGTGAEAAKRFDDVLDALNLTADKAPGIMDALVLSHQKYGGSINANIDALSAMGPALNASNLSVDDGIGLLNMFAAAGVDAAGAPQALQKALGKVKSPAELKALIDDISSTADPFLRAQKAADLFGAKAGAKLAQALSKGKIEDFTVSMDEAAGASTKAADTIQSGFGNQAQLVVKNFGGALAEIGTNFGPLILGFGALLPALTPIITTAGAALGGLLAAAIPVGIAALPVLLVAAVVAAIAFLVMNPEIVAQIGEFVGSMLATFGEFLSGLPQLLLNVFTTAFNFVIAAAPGFITSVVGFILSIPFRILDLEVKVLEFFAGIFTRVLAGLPGFIGDLVAFLFTIPGKLVNLGAQMGRAIIDGLAKLPGQLANAIGDAFRSLKVDVGPFHITGSGITIDLPKIDLPSFAVGSNFIPADMLAMVHKGEIIIPAAESAAIRAGQTTLGSPAAGAAGGATYNINVTNPVPHAADDDIGRMLRRLGSLGIAS
jgi:hypothetical protein